MAKIELIPGEPAPPPPVVIVRLLFDEAVDLCSAAWKDGADSDFDDTALEHTRWPLEVKRAAELPSWCLYDPDDD